MKKIFVILLILFPGILAAENSNSNKLLNILNTIVTGDTKYLQEQEFYLTGDDLKNFLLNNEITIVHNNIKHSYFFNSNFTYEVFSYPYKGRKLIASDKWELLNGYGVGPGYNSRGNGFDFIYLNGFRSNIQDAKFVFLPEKKEIKVVGNIQNPSDYQLIKIENVVSREEVKKIIIKIKEEEKIEAERVAELERIKLEEVEEALRIAELERIKQEEEALRIAELELIKLEEKLKKEKEELEKLEKEKQKKLKIYITILIILLVSIIILFGLNKKKKLKEIKKLEFKKKEERKKYLSENLGERLVEEVKFLRENVDEIKKWNKENSQFINKTKNYLINTLRKNNQNLIKKYEDMSKDIKEYNIQIKKEKEIYKKLSKKYSFVDKIIKARGIN